MECASGIKVQPSSKPRDYFFAKDLKRGESVYEQTVQVIIEVWVVCDWNERLDRRFTRADDVCELSYAGSNIGIIAIQDRQASKLTEAYTKIMIKHKNIVLKMRSEG